MKGEAAALSVRAQRCQSHYFSTTPRITLARFSASSMIMVEPKYVGAIYVYFNVNFNVFFELIIVLLLVSVLYIYCNILKYSAHTAQ